jgi:hypothetical protein
LTKSSQSKEKAVHPRQIAANFKDDKTKKKQGFERKIESCAGFG